MIRHRTIVFGWINDTIGSDTYGKPRAAVWRNMATLADLRKARRYAAEMRYRVFVYSTSEPKPLVRTRQAMLPVHWSYGTPR